MAKMGVAGQPLDKGDRLLAQIGAGLAGIERGIGPIEREGPIAKAGMGVNRCWNIANIEGNENGGLP